MRKFVLYFFSIFLFLTPFFYVQAQARCGLRQDAVFRNPTKSSYTGGETVQIAVCEDVAFSGNCSGFRVEVRVAPSTGILSGIDWNAGVVVGNPIMDPRPPWVVAGVGANCAVIPWSADQFNSNTTTYAIRGVVGNGRGGSSEAFSPTLSINGRNTGSPPGGGPITGGTGQTIGWGINNPFAFFPSGKQPDNVFEAVFLIIDWMANIAGSLLVIMIIYAGVKFVVSRGNPGELTKAKSILWWALVGMAVVLIGKGFVYIVDSILRGQIPIP